MNKLNKLIVSGIMLSLAMILPFVTGNIPKIGNTLCPMHLPVMLLAYLCGPVYGTAVGFLSPLVRFALFGMPPVIPIGLPMSFELATYALTIGVLYKILPKKPVYVYVSLVSSMIVGRLVWGVCKALLYGIEGKAFGIEMFFMGAFVNSVFGIIFQLAFIPALVIALEKYVNKKSGV